jgi:putative (di)nucleoside polyphosphate hydrolase
MDLTLYRPNVGVVLARGDGKVWLGRRARTRGPNNWQFPQGGMDEWEAPYDAALRELKEETGVSTVSYIARTEDWLAYTFPKNYRGAKANRGWLGQKQLWFLLRFEGEESEIDLAAHNEIEFDRWRWTDLAEAPSVVAPFKREVYAKVVEAFTPRLVDMTPA